MAVKLGVGKEWKHRKTWKKPPTGFCPVGGKTAQGKAWPNPEKSSCDVWIFQSG